MKDSEFIELLNLYLDHEISAADAVRLEAEVQSNAARRLIYQDYCRMQKACKVLAHDFQTEPATVADKVVPFTAATAGRASRGSAFYTVGALAAAAACLAIIFVGRSRQQDEVGAPGAPAVAKVESTVTPVAKTVAIDTPQAQARTTRTASGIRRADQSAQATFVSSNALFFGSKPSVVPVATTTAQPADDQFRWLTGDLNLVSLDQPQVGFQVPPMTVQSEGQQLGGNRAPQKSQAPATEMVTFKYTLGR